jgi:cation diffusion facilitator family transporter
VGRRRYEPLGVIVLSTLMFVAAAEVIISSSGRVATGITDEPIIPHVDIFVVLVLGITVVVKLALFLFCRHICEGSVAVEALKQDHRNDVVANLVSIGGVMLTSEIESWWWADPAVAIALSLWIVASWFEMGKEQLQFIAGKSASKKLVAELTYVAMTHSADVEVVDTVRAYHVGMNHFVEVHIVLPGDMPLAIAHDIGESMEGRIERIEGVERAFVHLDVDANHKPEHKTI